MIDSMDFRFLTSLRAVTVSKHSCLPGPKGHHHVKIHFTHEPNCRVQLDSKPTKRGIHVEHRRERTSAIVPPEPAWDQTYWQAASDDRSKVKIDVLIERVWWSLEEEDGDTLLPKSDWKDKPIHIPRSMFRATSRKAICLWFPNPGWMKKVRVGFEGSRSRTYVVSANQRKVSIPLRDLCDASEIAEHTKTALLRLWIDHADVSGHGAVLCEIEPEEVVDKQPPKSPPVSEPKDPRNRRCCSTCDHARNKKRIIWCRRHHWDGKVPEYVFDKKYSCHFCQEWRGEYYDSVAGKWVD